MSKRVTNLSYLLICLLSSLCSLMSCICWVDIISNSFCNWLTLWKLSKSLVSWSCCSCSLMSSCCVPNVFNWSTIASKRSYNWKIFFIYYKKYQLKDYYFLYPNLNPNLFSLSVLIWEINLRVIDWVGTGLSPTPFTATCVWIVVCFRTALRSD